MSGAARRARRQAKRANSTKHELLGECSHPDCGKNAYSEFSCKTCEALADAKQMCTGNVVSYRFCFPHQEWAFGRIKKHAMVGHPANIIRAVAAGLRGEEI